MNKSQLRKMGFPEDCIAFALAGIQAAAKAGELRGMKVKKLLPHILSNPEEYCNHPFFAELSREIVTIGDESLPEPISYKTWGEDIDSGAHQQMEQACSVPGARMGALMPDAHIGYGLPIGGVLGVEQAVIPYAVGVDIACRMKLSIIDLPASSLKKQTESYRQSLEYGTRFGVGVTHEKPKDHAVLDLDWSVTRVTRENKDKAWKQLGTSGSGNHFVEFGLVSIIEHANDLNLEPGTYVALLSHSGSRGTGASVCSTYSSIARSRLPKKYQQYSRLAWLDLDSQAGQEYWAAMNLMGEYASANHDVIHRLVTRHLGARIISGVENHHNFAWKEEHDGQELIVHRKGATPAAAGELGVIPGSMATPAYIVRGKGNSQSLRSASHGAGRKMSRTKAKEKYTWNAVKKSLAQQGIQVLSAGADEVPGAYKDIEQVMQAQQDLVDIVAKFEPRIVKMCGDGSRAED